MKKVVEKGKKWKLLWYGKQQSSSPNLAFFSIFTVGTGNYLQAPGNSDLGIWMMLTCQHIKRDLIVEFWGQETLVWQFIVTISMGRSLGPEPGTETGYYQLFGDLNWN